MAQLKTELPTTTAALIEVAKGATNIGALEITRINSFVDGALRQVYMGRTTYGSLTLVTAAVQLDVATIAQAKAAECNAAFWSDLPEQRHFRIIHLPDTENRLPGDEGYVNPIGRSALN